MQENDSSRPPPGCSYQDARIALSLPPGWDDARVSFAPPRDPTSAGFTIAREHATEGLMKRVMSKLVGVSKHTELALELWEDIEVAGRAAKRLRFAPRSDEGPIDRCLVVVDKGPGESGEALVITSTTLRARRDETFPVFAHLLASIQPASDDDDHAPRVDSRCRLGSFVFAPPPGWRPRVHAQAHQAEIEVMREQLQGREPFRSYLDRKLLAIGALPNVRFGDGSFARVGGRSGIGMRFHDGGSEHTLVLVDPGDDTERNVTVFCAGAPRNAAKGLLGTLTEVLRSVRFDAVARSGRVTRAAPEGSPRVSVPFVPIPGISYR